MNNHSCDCDTGAAVDWWYTGDIDCDAVSTKYECGGVYNKNFMDVKGSREHDCFWDCENCRYRDSHKNV